jgi:hypothetical protein
VKSIADIVAGREPTSEEQENLTDVVEIARAWELGALDLRGVRSACSGHDRWRAMRFAGVGNADKHLLMRLADALCADLGDMDTKQGTFQQRDLREHGAWVHPDPHGRRIIRFKTIDNDGRTYFREVPDYKLTEGDRDATD